MALIDRSILEDAEEFLPEVVKLRRKLHQHPELGLDLPFTQAAIIEALEGLPVTITTGRQLSSVVVELEGSGPGRRVLLRGDMDALEMPEDTGLPFSSQVPNAMHACGHDGHVSMLVGAVHLLAARRDDWSGSVRFMFQPGEEGYGGAPLMIEEGVTKDVDAAFAIHVTPNLPSGWVATRPGALLASEDTIAITVRGRGGHASTPHLAADPVTTTAEIVMAIQATVTRQIDIFNPAVVTLTQLRASDAPNVIPESVFLGGTIRTVSEHTRTKVKEAVTRTALNVAAAHGLEAEVNIKSGYPVTTTHPATAALVLKIAPKVLPEGGRAVEAPAPTMGAEDWSYVLQEVPGAMAFLGVCPPEIPDPRNAPACHSNVMMMNEDAMASGVALHVAMALRLLEGPA